MTRLIALILLTAGPALAQQPASQPASETPANAMTPSAAAPAPTAAPGTEMPVQEWNAEDYEVSKPALNLLELDGYFRVRGDSIFNGTLGNDTFGTIIQGAPGSIAPPSLNYAATQNYRRLLATSSSSQSGANMRARITPTLNITEDIQLIATFDLFDDLVLGSTPNTSPSNVPQVNILNVGQNSSTANWNALRNAVQLKRLYAKVATPLGELRFGRMPNQWGLGMYANSGDCIDCDYGDNVDRVAFVGMLGSFYIVPMIDFMSTGPTTASLTGSQGQARDLDTSDNATQFSLQLARKDAPEDIKEKLSRGELVINYGLWNMFRAQVKEATTYYANPTATSYSGSNPGVDVASSLSKLDSRNAFAYVVDGWFKLQYKHFTFEYEGLFTYAKFELQKSTTDTSFGYNFARQWGMTIDTRYDFTSNVFVRLRAGIASGDNTPGFGVGDDAYAKRGAYAKYDNTIDNFQFNRDYRVDLLLFRELIGTVTGAYYIKPEVTYTFSNGLGGTFAPIYGQALFVANTPAAAGKGTTTPLGVELDAEIFYHPKKMKGFEASISYGLLIPFDSFSRPDLGAGHGTSVAQRLLGRLAVIF